MGWSAVPSDRVTGHAEDTVEEISPKPWCRGRVPTGDCRLGVVMLVVLGLIILLAAVIVGVAGVLGNAGSEHALTDGFAVFGYHMTGSTGTLFLIGIVVGVAAALGLGLLLAGARRTSRRGREARRELKQSRRETAAISQERDDLVDQRSAERADKAADTPRTTSPDGDADP